MKHQNNLMQEALVLVYRQQEKDPIQAGLEMYAYQVWMQQIFRKQQKFHNCTASVLTVITPREEQCVFFSEALKGKKIKLCFSSSNYL